LKSYVFDTSAVLRYLESGPGAPRVEALLNNARDGECKIVMSAVNWGEVLYVLLRKLGRQDALAAARSVRSLPIGLVSAGEAEAESAADLKDRYSLAYADCFAAALAIANDATLLTGDFDFKSCQSELLIEFLPRSSASH